MAKTNAQKQRAIRQDALREWLSEKCTAQHLVDNLKKIEGLDPYDEKFTNELAKYKVANEQRLKIMNKYLGDMSHATLEADTEDGSFNIVVQSFADKPTKWMGA